MVLSMPDNSWICLIMPDYSLIYLDGFCLTYTHCNGLVTGKVKFWKVKT